jgi:hypothetical protein
MSLDNLNLPSDVAEENTDTLPGTGSYLLDTGVYDMICKLAYKSESRGGATAINFRFETPDGSKSHRETIYVTSGRAKGQKPTYTDRKTGEERPLPGFTAANEISLALTGKKLGQLQTEEKTVKLWNYDAGEEVPTPGTEVIMEMVGKPCKLGIILKRENKNVNNGTQDAPKWEPGPDMREFNEINKAFNADGLTSTEVKAGEGNGEFLERWQARFPSDYVDEKNWNPALAEQATAASEPALPTPAEDDDLFA